MYVEHGNIRHSVRQLKKKRQDCIWSIAAGRFARIQKCFVSTMVNILALLVACQIHKDCSTDGDEYKWPQKCHDERECKPRSAIRSGDRIGIGIQLYEHGGQSHQFSGRRIGCLRQFQRGDNARIAVHPVEYVVRACEWECTCRRAR